MGGLAKEDSIIDLEAGKLEEVDSFKYFGYELDCEGGVEIAVRGRIITVWIK